MTRIVVLGGTGYAGRHIVRTAAQRGHEVLSVSRHTSGEDLERVVERVGDVQDPQVLEDVVADADVVLSALSPRGALEPVGTLRAIEQQIGRLAAQRGIRFGVVGGAGSLLVAEGGPKLMDTPEFPAEFKAEPQEMERVLQDLRAADASLDWFFVSPAAGFGAFAPGEATGRYRVGGDVLLTDEEGTSFISGADLALAVIDEIEQPAHRRTRFTVAS